MADLFLEAIASNFQSSEDFKNFSSLDILHGFEEKRFLRIVTEGEIRRLKFLDETIVAINFSGGKSEYFENGKYTDWYSNGQIASTGYYIDGEVTGHWKYWDNNGNVTAELNY
jgi:hypothetical protein